jgi:perosamine synthetase
MDTQMQFIPISQPSITQKEIDYVTDAVTSGWISSLGKYIDRFEAEFAAFCGTKYAVSLANGTVAIHLALEALGIGEGDEVIMPDLSFVATANATLHAGATPIFVDIDPFNYCIDPALIEAAITPRTKAIMPVHLYGHPANMVEINRIAEKHGLLVIEDAAEAHGASIHGKRTGSWGFCATFSFYGNKNITTGEGGMITTNDEAFYHKCRHLRDHAMSKEKRYWHTEVGYNYRMTNLQAALGCAQMERSTELLQRRIDVYHEYAKGLADVKGISLNRTNDWATNTYWLVCLEIDNATAEVRDAFIARLREKGVDTRPFFYPMSEMPYLKINANTPVSHKISQQGLNLPTYVDLTNEQIAYICEAIKAVL